MAQIIGRVAQDATVKQTSKNKELVSFSVVENFYYKTKTGERKQDSTFYDCAYWRSTGIAPYLKKGTRIVVTGKIKATPYTSSQGEAKAGLQLTVQDIQL